MPKKAFMYLRTSSATNVGEDKDSGNRQRVGVAVEQHGERDPGHAARPARHAPSDVVLLTPRPHRALALAGQFRGLAQRHALALVIRN